MAFFPREGDDVLVDELGWSSGGAGANVAAALALLGAPARLLARVGHDPAAALALAAAGAAGADLGAVQRDPNLATGVCFAAISPSGERTFFSFRGANAALDLPEPAALEGARWLHLCGHALIEGRQRTTALALLDQAQRRGLPVSLDLCLPLLRAHRSTLADLLPKLRLLFANQDELAALCPGLPQEQALDELLAHGPAIVVLKLGPTGSVLAEGRSRLRTPGFAVAAIDTNGCGDAFAAGFLAALLRGAPLDECATVANAVGALTATKHGAADALPSAAQVRALLSETHRG
ncbi:MAG: carbohydrate kinase family protein [Roseiflexaceae bacterium]